MIKLPKLVFVRWIDPKSAIGWFAVEDVNEMKPAEITSIGYLARNSKGIIAITTSVCDEGQVADPLIIPKKFILEIKEISETKKIKFKG